MDKNSSLIEEAYFKSVASEVSGLIEKWYKELRKYNDLGAL